MLVALLGDLHFGMRNDRVEFHEYYRQFYHNVLFPTLEQENISWLIQLGDVFDRRKIINFNTLYLAKRDFFDEVMKRNIKMRIIPGNHDAYFKNTLEVNSPALLLGEYGDNVRVITKPEQRSINGKVNFDFIPWICQDNMNETLDFISKSKNKVCIGHFQIQGFKMSKNDVCHDGISPDIFKRYERVFSGHFHHPSTIGNISYVGSPGEMNWMDYDDPRGFWILDTNNLSTRFVQNPYKLHVKLAFISKYETNDTVVYRDYSQYAGKIIMLEIDDKSNRPLVECFIKKLEAVHPLELTIKEVIQTDPTSYVAKEDFADDTLALTLDYIEQMELASLGLDKNKLKSIVQKMYLKSQDIDNIRDLNVSDI